jgi:glycosyltransferase involved in cell wall biosynthesis
MDLSLRPPVRPVVSVVVPARNEEACLGLCLQSLATQTGIPFEIIVVDDGSTDRTRKIAESFSGVRVVDPGPLPPNWTGKNHAMAAGAAVALGEWLLFTDADTVHKPGSLVRAVAEAQRQGVSLLSYSPEQEVHGFWEKAVMPVIFAELATAYPPQAVNDPASPIAAANGQYLMISREAYHAVGGHAAIAVDLLEDVALARLVKRSGRRIFFRYGADAVRTRMYRSFAQMKEGWTKNLALLFPSLLKLALVRSVEFVLIVGGIAVAAGILATHGELFLTALVAGTGLLLYIRFLTRIRRAHFSWRANVLSIFGLPIFSYLLFSSWHRYRRGNVDWKGRTYHPSPNRVGTSAPCCPAEHSSAGSYS